MTDALDPRISCLTCSGPLRAGLTGWRCFNGIVPAPSAAPSGTRPGIDCDGRKRTILKGPRPKAIEVYVCSYCCARTKWDTRIPSQKPEPDCACGGRLVFAKAQSR